MASKPEALFYEWLSRNLPWFFQRIETTTASGVPDVWAAHKGHSLWIEIKALPATNVQIRKAQYAWMSKCHWNGVPVWLFNRNPRRTTVIQAWRTPFEVEPGKKDHLKIISQPVLALPAEKFAQLELQQLSRF